MLDAENGYGWTTDHPVIVTHDGAAPGRTRRPRTDNYLDNDRYPHKVYLIIPNCFARTTASEELCTSSF